LSSKTLQSLPEKGQADNPSACEKIEPTDEYKKGDPGEERADDISEYSECIECVKAIPIISVDEIEEGDHIVFSGAVYDHHGIVVSRLSGTDEIEIVEATNSIVGATLGIFFGGKAKIQRSVKRFNFATDNIRVVVYRYPDSKENVIRRALDFVSEGGSNRNKFKYNLLSNNCEHFATFCATGKEFSIQIRKFAMIASIFVLRGFRGISDEKLRNEKEYENNIICRHCYEINTKLLSVRATPIVRNNDVNIGDVIRYSYWNLWHDAVVLSIMRKESKFVLCKVAHYCFHSPFLHREIIAEELKIYLNGSVSVLHYEPPYYDVYDPDDVVHRAKQRMGETCFAFFSNDSSSFARWCKLKLIRQFSVETEV
jgi:hypothetical protein